MPSASPVSPQQREGEITEIKSLPGTILLLLPYRGALLAPSVTAAQSPFLLLFYKYSLQGLELPLMAAEGYPASFDLLQGFQKAR